MEWWNNGIVAFHALVVKEKAASGLRRRRLFARRAPPHHSIFPTFHHSNQLRSAAELSSSWTSDFKQVIEGNYCYVDKTFFIKEQLVPGDLFYALNTRHL